MPNHVKSRLTIVGTPDQVQQVFERFNTHVPSELRKTHDDVQIICKKIGGGFEGWYNPDTNKFESANNRGVLADGLPDGMEYEYSKAFDHFPDFEKVIPPPSNMFRGDLSLEDEKRCAREGVPTWYRWHIDNWGTKWNSYSCEKESDNVFLFETAWAGVPNMIQEMSKAFPDVLFEYEYADEDTGCNCGTGIYKGGTGGTTPLENTSKEAYDLAFKLRPHYADDYELVDGEWQYKEEE